jgi:hypothetical protein
LEGEQSFYKIGPQVREEEELFLMEKRKFWSVDQKVGWAKVIGCERIVPPRFRI